MRRNMEFFQKYVEQLIT